MATGDQSDVQSRLQALLPAGWFARGATPLKDALLLAAANAYAFVYSLFVYVRQQTRIATASDGFLDMVAADFFGTSVLRLPNQSDASFRALILATMFRERATRRAITLVLTQLTGRAPVIFEPTRPLDTGVYGSRMGYGLAGGYGSLSLPLQCFVTAYRQASAGIPFVAGYGVSVSGYSTPSSGEWASAAAALTNIDDNTLFAAVDAVRPAGSIIWMRLSN